MADYSQRTDCRLCASTRLESVLELTPTPPANAFVTAAERDTPQACFPLQVFQCQDCGHAQLLDIVDPELLFSNYVYVSGTSPVFVAHFRDYATAINRYFPQGPKLVLDIGSNDGTLLKAFADLGWRVQGVDPARAIAAEANAAGIPTETGFFTPALAQDLRARVGLCDVITANNVFAHADDLSAIASGVRELLAPNGLFVFEVSYWLDVFSHCLFDTIYHEHLSYHSLAPLLGFLERHGLHVIEAVRVAPHGGSLRVIAQVQGAGRTVGASVAALLAEEASAALHTPDGVRPLAARIEAVGQALKAHLAEARAAERRIAGFGAPAKATTLMYQFDLNQDVIEFIVDDSPWKQGLFTPGLHVPVVSSDALMEYGPDEVVILAWNFADAIMAKQQAYLAAGGCFVVPLPNLRIVRGSTIRSH